MRTRFRAFALITVLMISIVVLILILAGLQFAGKNLFTMAKVHDRNLALYAAEAGVYQTLADIETLDRYPDDGLRPRVQLSNGANYQVQLTRAGNQITLRSEGRAPRAVRTLEVVVQLSPDSFFGVATEGPIGLADDTFVNGVFSTLNPKPGKGNIHTNNANTEAILSEATTSNPTRLSVTGEATAVGGIRTTVVGKHQAQANYVDPLQVNRDELLGTHSYTTLSELPADGIIRGHRRISEVDWEGPLHIEEGAVLHVTGDLALARGVTGSGTLVVDGQALVRASDRIDLENPKGVFLYAQGGLAMIHPQAYRETIEIVDFTPPEATEENPNPQPRPSESRETFVHVPDPAAAFFASRPVDTEFNLRQGLPLDAPTDLEFFEYYERQMLSPSETFEAWMNGDPDLHIPGLRPEVKQWLEKGRQDPEIRNSLRRMAQEPRQ